jgi:hypothetical protein
MIENWLKSLSLPSEEYTFPSKKHEYLKEFPDLYNTKVALLSVNEQKANPIRTSLDKFKNNFPEIEFTDLGNVMNDSPEFILQLLTELIDGGIIPIILGADEQTLSKLANYLSNQALNEQCTFVSNNIRQSCLEINTETKSFLGFQRHLIDSQLLNENSDTLRNSLSLGQLRTAQSIVEPVIRDSSIVYFNMDSIRRSESLNSKNSLPTGLNVEEGCQLLRYAGEAVSLKCLCFDFINTEIEENSQESTLIAELIWYFLEGVSNRKNDHPTKNKDYQEFIVNLNNIDEPISFVKSNISQRWWLKINDEGYYSCSSEEYNYTIEHELPERLIQKFY